MLSGCGGTRYLEKDQKLLHNQSIEAPKSFDKSELNDFYVQKANRKFLWVFNSLTWMYYWGLRSFNKETSWPVHSKTDFVRKKELKEKKFDRKIAATTNPRRIANLQFRKQQKSDAFNFKIENGNLPMQWGEKVSIFDSVSTQATVDKLNTYLFTHGYFEGKTQTEFREKARKVSIKYTLIPGQPFIYDTIFYRVADSAALRLVRQFEEESKIKVGERYDQKKLSDERDRLDLIMKDHGYYDFSKQYIDFQIDTTYKHKHAIALQMSISDPVYHDSHKTFKIDSVNFVTDASVKSPRGTKRQSVMYKDVRFHYFIDQYSKKILRNRAFLHHDSLYSRSNTLATQRQLANLDIFKFVNVNYDTSGGKFIANIFTSPLDRYAWTNEAGVTVTQGFPGPYYSLSFKKRNIFKGLEIFELNGRFGFEGVAAATEIGGVYKSTEAGINTSVTFPQFLFPVGKYFEVLGKYNPKTRLLAGYTYTDRPEYQRSNVTLSNTYTWQNKKTTQYSFTLTNLQVIQSTLTESFDSLLTYLQVNQGNNLKNSFKPSLVSSMIFTMTWNPNDYGNAVRSSFFMRVTAESGGTLFNLYTPQIAIDNGLQIYKYIRLGLDLRKKQVIDRNTSLAYRFNTGIAYSYGSDGSLPYEKYFFVGGSNSVRAWRPRRLGIGSAPPPLTTNPVSNGTFNYQYEKPGEILLEGSVEWRKKLFGFVNGAIFIDAGNVWSFKQSKPPDASGENVASWAQQGNTKFYFDKFLSEIAIGTGFGLRFDFNFLVLRLDIGIKAWDPARAPGDRFVLDRLSFFKPYAKLNPDGTYSNIKEPVIWNVGIGYPF